MEMIGKCSAKPFYYDCDCECDPAIDVEEFISRAMISAKEAEAYYFAMAAKADCEVDKDMFCEFSAEQKKAYALLQQILRELTCECYCVGDLCIDEPEGFCSAIKTAIYNEMDIINDYENIAYYLTDITQREIMVLLIEEARIRAEKLAALYEFAQACACKCGKDDECGCGCNPNPCCCYVFCYDACGRPILPHQMPPCSPSPCTPYPPFPPCPPPCGNPCNNGCNTGCNTGCNDGCNDTCGNNCGAYHCPPPRPYPGAGCGCNGGSTCGCNTCDDTCGCHDNCDCHDDCDNGITPQICISGNSKPCTSTYENVYGAVKVNDCGCGSTSLSSLTRFGKNRKSPWGGKVY